MPLECAIQDVHWYRQLNDEGEERFFCNMPDCCKLRYGYTRISSLNSHMQPLHNKKASNCGRGALKFTGPPPCITRSATASLHGSRKHTEPRSKRARNSSSDDIDLLERRLQQAISVLQKLRQRSTGAANKGKARARSNSSEPSGADYVHGASSLQPFGEREEGVPGSHHGRIAIHTGQRSGRRQQAVVIHGNVDDRYPLVISPGSGKRTTIFDEPGSPEMLRSRPALRNSKCGSRRPPPRLTEVARNRIHTPATPLLIGLVPGEGGESSTPDYASAEDLDVIVEDGFEESPCRFSKCDPTKVLVSAMRSIRETIVIEDDGVPYKTYDIDRPSPIRRPRGATSGRPVLLQDSPIRIVKKEVDDDSPASIGNAMTAVNFKWTPGHRRETFFLPALHNKDMPSALDGKVCSPETAELSSQEISSPFLAVPSASSTAQLVVAEIPGNQSLTETLDQVGRLPTLPPILLENVTVTNSQKSPTSVLEMPLESLSQIGVVSTQSLELLLDEFATGDMQAKSVPRATKVQNVDERNVDYAADSVSE